MRILDVSPYRASHPVSGANTRVHNLLGHLARHHDVELFALPWREPFAARPRMTVTDLPAGYRERLWNHPVAWAANEIGRRSWVTNPVLSGLGLRAARPRALDRLLPWADVVVVEYPWMFEHCRRRVRGTPLVLATHNVEAQKFPSWARGASSHPGLRPLMRYVRHAEARAVRSADRVVAVSPDDAADLVSLYGIEPSRVVEVPNGADPEAFPSVDAEARRAARRDLGLPERPTALFVASGMAANRAAYDWIRRVGARTDRFNFLVVGNVAPPQRVGPVVSCGHVVDISTHMRAADLAICPVAHGGGTKIKLLEALAAGLPTVAFAEALHGTEARDGEHLLVAPQEEAGAPGRAGAPAPTTPSSRRGSGAPAGRSSRRATPGRGAPRAWRRRWWRWWAR